MRRALFGFGVLVAVTTGGCKGGGNGDRMASSGLPRTTPTGSLSPTDAAKLCDWTNQLRGGYARTVACASDASNAMTDSDQGACLASGPFGSATCPTLTVGDVEDCVNATGGDICQTRTVAGCAAINSRCIAIDRTAAEIAQTICPKAYLCCTTAQLMNNASAEMTEADCEIHTRNDYTSFLNSVQASLNAGRSRYERSKVDACLTTIRTSTCAMLNVTNHISGVPGCKDVTTPLVPAGGACTHDFECIVGVCVIPSGLAEGTCGPGVAAGQSCVEATCAPGLTCDPKDGASATDDICALPQANGASCDDPYQCESFNCAAPSAGGPMTCTATPLCFYSSACAAAGRPNAGTLLIAAAVLMLAVFRRGRRATARARR